MIAGGVEVVPLETVVASPSFQTLKMTGSTAAKPYVKKSRDAKTSYVAASPSSIPLWFTNFDGDISDQGMGQTNIRALLSMARELDALMLFRSCTSTSLPSAAAAANPRAALR